ncbi:MAG: hypothetical protein L6Q26_06980 [Anaerolineales bacterium]|nr:hypothetical protein [Anaerolineales bacterium]NUQ84850.1 hypothetical protein [Anaerolineales bacterium]
MKQFPRCGWNCPVFIDLLGFSLILPLLPFYSKQYSASPCASRTAQKLKGPF